MLNFWMNIFSVSNLKYPEILAISSPNKCSLRQPCWIKHYLFNILILLAFLCLLADIFLYKKNFPISTSSFECHYGLINYFSNSMVYNPYCCYHFYFQCPKCGQWGFLQAGSHALPYPFPTAGPWAEEGGKYNLIWYWNFILDIEIFNLLLILQLF